MIIAKRIVPFHEAHQAEDISTMTSAGTITGCAAPLALLVGLLLALCPAVRARQDTGEFYNPLKAEKAVEVGTFYLKKKNYDAAIERFLEAIHYKANHAKAHRLLGEALEKKGELADAVIYYQKYLEILPAAEDGDKVRKRIEKLNREVAKRAARRRSS